ncbi:MAG: ABC transporter permease [Candidatus Brockarchaeota archaeon]|nr:ABC transporter permease [Candidatus Brockarchaeota archaeon]
MNGANGFHPSTIRGLRALTARELKKWLKDPMMISMFVLQPLIWMGLLGKSMNIGALFSGNLSVQVPEMIPIPGNYVVPEVDGVVYVSGSWFSRTLQQMFSEMGAEVMRKTFGVTDYFSYMSIGMVSMIVTTTAMFSGMSIVWDRRLGFLDKVLSTPVSRAAIIFSKVLNSTLRAMFQATVILAIAYVLGLQVSPTFKPLNLIGVYVAIFLLSVGLSSVFLAVSIRSTRMERPMQIVNLIMMPLMFASNNFYPTSMMPIWIQTIANANPLTYLTDAVRQLTILPLNPSTLMVDFIYLGTFASLLATIGTLLSWRYLTK